MLSTRSRPSSAIAPELRRAAGFLLHERVEIYNVTNGERFATYVIGGTQRGEIMVNGAAARLVQPGDEVIIAAYAIPGFLFAILLMVLFAGGSYWRIFPLRGLTSEGWENFTPLRQVTDYLWHIVLPIVASTIASFATLTLLTKNSFLDEIKKQYVMTARAKGLTDNQVLYGHVFRNAMLIVVAGFPSAFLGAFFGSSLLIETIFSLDGLGLLSFESVVNRDYPVVFGTLYIFSLIGLVINLISDLTYTWIDPRIDFESREV